MAPPGRSGYNQPMATPTPLPPKKDVARGLLLRGSIFVHLDPRKPGVQVPTWLREQAQVVLQLGLDMPVPIPDLRVDDSGVFGTLSFQRSPFTCSVPWSAVFALVGDDGKGMVWPEDLPPEIAAEVEREALRPTEVAGPAASAPSASSSNGRAKKGAARNASAENGARPSRKPRAPMLAPTPAPSQVMSSDEPESVVIRARDHQARSSKPGSSNKSVPRRAARELPPYLRVIK